ncbi:hypothetical protein GCM10027256_09780 [Novispirillum itersonii subsp. nipponicum]
MAGTFGQRQREKGAPARENPDRCKESGFQPETPENRRAGHGREGRRTGRELIPKTGEDTLRDPAADCPKNRRNHTIMSEVSLPDRAADTQGQPEGAAPCPVVRPYSVKAVSRSVSSL